MLKSLSTDVVYVISAKLADDLKNFRWIQIASDPPNDKVAQHLIIVSCSGQFSEKGFLVISEITARFQAQLHVISLRAETSFMLNGDAITQYNGPKNNVNVGMTTLEIIFKERSIVNEISHASDLTVKSTYRKSKDALTNEHVVDYGPDTLVEVKSIRCEGDFVTALGHGYEFIPFQDHRYAHVQKVILNRHNICKLTY